MPSNTVCQLCGLSLSWYGEKWRHNMNGRTGKSRCRQAKPVLRVDYDAQNTQAAKDMQSAIDRFYGGK
jgi:hypothetical protein